VRWNDNDLRYDVFVVLKWFSKEEAAWKPLLTIEEDALKLLAEIFRTRLDTLAQKAQTLLKGEGGCEGSCTRSRALY
jgi:hypothetical protein